MTVVAPADDASVAHRSSPAPAVEDVSLPLGVVRIDYNTFDDFERLHGDLMMHILPTVTGLTLDQLRSEGGVAVVEAGTGRVLWEWPRR